MGDYEDEGSMGESGEEMDDPEASDFDEEAVEDLEDQEIANKNIKLPDDLEGEDENMWEYGDEMGKGFEGSEEGENEVDEGKMEKEESVDIENDVFAMARENKEMDDKKTYANPELVDKINKIEDEMMD